MSLLQGDAILDIIALVMIPIIFFFDTTYEKAIQQSKDWADELQTAFYALKILISIFVIVKLVWAATNKGKKKVSTPIWLKLLLVLAEFIYATAMLVLSIYQPIDK